MKNLLKNKNLNETAFRKDVLAIFYRYKNAIPLSIIEKELKEYNRITLYRTIKIFIKKGIIHEIPINGGVSNFAICPEECDTAEHHHHHIHFKCKDCGIIFCVEIDKFPIINLPKYKITKLEIMATGSCQNCNL